MRTPLVVVVGIGLTALTTQRGLLARLREAYLEPLSLELSWSTSQSLGDIVSAIVGVDVRIFIIGLVVVALLYWVFRSHGPLGHRHTVVGITIGICVALGWFITFTMQQHVFEVVSLAAGSFVLPPGNLIMHVISGRSGIPDYTVGMTVGVVLGAAFSAYQTKDLRWEACDDARELGRHLLGAFLMGVGGVLAVGYTIGQGVSAASTLALSAPIALLSIILGARMGLSWLLEGSLLSFIRRH